MKHMAVLFALCVIWFFAPGCATAPVAHEATRTGIIVEELAKSTLSWDGQTLPPYPGGQPEISIRRITVPAGARLDTHIHPVINAGVLTRGQLTVVKTDGRILHLKQGDAIVELVNAAHYGMNQGKRPAEIIVVYAGVIGAPIAVHAPPLSESQ